MQERVTISYRGAHYQLGRGRHFYGIWAAGEPRSQPLSWWPDTADGWSAAWSRFTAMETPGSIARAGRRSLRTVPASAASRGVIAAAALLGVGILCGLIGLFPGYLGGTSLAGQAYQLVPHLIYLAGWAASAVLILRGGSRLQAGALLGVGVSIVTLGLFLADLGQATAGSAAGAGLALALAGWVCCAAGSAAAFWFGAAGAPARPRNHELGHIAMVVIAGLGAALAFAPSWDAYTLRLASTGAVYSVTAGNAFAFPGVVIAGNVIAMVAMVAVAAAAVLWRPARSGAVLLAGAIIPLAALAISALVLQLGQGASPAQFGFTPAQAGQAGLRISSGLTPVFWVYCVFVVALAASCAWMYLTPDPGTAAPHPAGPGDHLPGPGSPSTVLTGTVLTPAGETGDDGDEDDDFDDDFGEDDDGEGADGADVGQQQTS